jgi:hypothetical protein
MITGGRASALLAPLPASASGENGGAFHRKMWSFPLKMVI